MKGDKGADGKSGNHVSSFWPIPFHEAVFPNLYETKAHFSHEEEISQHTSRQIWQNPKITMISSQFTRKYTSSVCLLTLFSGEWQKVDSMDAHFNCTFCHLVEEHLSVLPASRHHWHIIDCCFFFFQLGLIRLFPKAHLMISHGTFICHRTVIEGHCSK